MNWKDIYNNKKTTAEKAIEAVSSGDRVVLAHAAAEPTPLVNALMQQKSRLTDVEIVHMVSLGECEYCKPEYEGIFRHNSVFVGAKSRQAIAEKRADFTPVFFSNVPGLFKDGTMPVDVAFIQVAPPDEFGFCSYGVSVDYTMAAAETARIVIAEVNEQMPQTVGSYIHVDDIDFVVETDRPLIELQPPTISNVERKIGEYVASMVPDGANLQLGIGAIPDAALLFLKDKKDLGIHTEMFSDGVVELFEEGVITNKYNNLNPNRLTATFLMGTRKLYDFVHKNPHINMQPVDYTNNVMVAGQLDKLISINSALQVDFYGQVAADMIGPKQFTSVGGQVDFVRAAGHSSGGKSIIAFPSTAAKGKISRIVPNLDAGACVTTSRFDVQYIITEYGIADLRGKSIRQRTEALIAIAHPDFRKELEKNL